MQPLIVYLADLRHDYSGVLGSHCMPLNVAYMKAVLDRDLPEVRSRLFAYPDRLEEAIWAAPPDVLMVSNYVWNESLSLHFAKLAKRINPGALVVMGGPNLPLEEERRIGYVRHHPQIDIYVLGEGDYLATEVVRQFLDAGNSIEELSSRDIPSCIYRRPDGSVTHQRMWPRHKEVDDIPSPWLAGILDEFFDGKLTPLIETNRGCPFTCTFCVQGTGYYTNKIHYFSVERLKEEIGYIARRIQTTCPTMGILAIADSNFGMFERDLEIADYIGDMQKKYGWPTLIDATTGKNRADRTIQALEKMNGALVVLQAAQSLNADVLRNIRRSNIKLEAYEQVMNHVRGRGLRSISDLILGLPGETLDTHLEAIHSLIDAGTNHMHTWPLHLLKGSELETQESRNSFSFDTRFRVVQHFGVYEGEKVFDLEEVVVATHTMSFQDYLEARKYHLAVSVFWNDGWFEEVVRLVKTFGIRPSEWLDTMLLAMENARGPVRRFFADFVRETVNELFPSREACLEFYSVEENFQRLLAGEIGENLLYKYRAVASFHIWPDICTNALDATKDLLLSHGAASEIGDFERFWPYFRRFVELKHASGLTVADILAPANAIMEYDIGRWLADGLPKDTALYKLDRPTEFEFRLTEEGARELWKAFQVWTPSLKGLTKLVSRLRVSWQVRECLSVEQKAS